MMFLEVGSCVEEGSKAQQAACGRGFDSGRSRHIQGIWKSEHWEMVGKERNSGSCTSLAGLVIGYLQMGALESLQINSSIKEGRKSYHHLKHLRLKSPRESWGWGACWAAVDGVTQSRT